MVTVSGKARRGDEPAAPETVDGRPVGVADSVDRAEPRRLEEPEAEMRPIKRVMPEGRMSDPERKDRMRRAEAVAPVVRGRRTRRGEETGRRQGRRKSDRTQWASHEHLRRQIKRNDGARGEPLEAKGLRQSAPGSASYAGGNSMPGEVSYRKRRKRNRPAATRIEPSMLQRLTRAEKLLRPMSR